MGKQQGQPSGRKRLSRAYVAGFIDADGSIVITRGSKGQRRNWYSIFVTVTQKNPEILHRLREKFGGRVHLHIKKDNPKICSTWRIQSGKAYELLKKIRPKLILKGDRALVAMRLQENIWKHKDKFTKTGLPQSILDYREQLKSQLQELNKPFSPAETEFWDAERRSDSPNNRNEKSIVQKPEEVC